MHSETSATHGNPPPNPDPTTDCGKMKVLLFVTVLACYTWYTEATTSTFLIQSFFDNNFYIHPDSGSHRDASENEILHVWGGKHAVCYFQFELVDGIWGYIRHVESNMIMVPKGHSTRPAALTHLVLTSSRTRAALFALDTVNHLIMHYGGMYIHPAGGPRRPKDGEVVQLYSTIHDGARWNLIDVNNPGQEVPVSSFYGTPTIGGRWKAVFVKMNQRAGELVHEVTYSIGKSQELSTHSSFEFGFETTVGGAGGAFSASATASFKTMVSRTSTSTWTSEKEVKWTKTVSEGQSVVTWQWIFEGSQCGHHAAFGSNIMADTDHFENPPDFIISNDLYFV
ncbi:hypothetical protein ScPMuIL_001821 [Solemya velum]